MNKKALLTLILASVATTSYAADQGLDACVAAVQKQQAGDIIKLEKLSVANKPFYELEIKDSKGAEYEFMCNAKTGKITEQETEVSSPTDEAFGKTAKISEDDAKATALKAHAGTITEVEYEIEANGSPSYEFDISNDKGVETKVEVDAVSGKIIETATEIWEIGEEADEKR
jgi:uncharacterized membrane protein YkoI